MKWNVAVTLWLYVLFGQCLAKLFEVRFGWFIIPYHIENNGILLALIVMSSRPGRLGTHQFLHSSHREGGQQTTGLDARRFAFLRLSLVRGG